MYGKDVVLSGDRPSGKLHLGHYVGSLQNRIELQHKHPIYILIADIQAITDNFNDIAKVSASIALLMEDYIACGLDPEKCCIFVQSGVRALFELTSHYMNLVTVARLQRNPTVKAELRQKGFAENVLAGFLCYPISQAADITAFGATLVPVGEDQLPMLEQTNEIVRKFNATYGVELLRECRGLMGETVRLMGIDGENKASKSLNNCIFLSDDSKTVKEKVMAMYTDPNHIRVSDPGQVEGNVVFHYLDAFYHDEQLQQLKADYRKGGLGDVVIKNLLFEVLEKFLAPIRERRAKIDKNCIHELLKYGTERANIVANAMVKQVREAMGLALY